MKINIQNKAWYFFFIVVLIYIILIFTNYTAFSTSISFFTEIIIKIIPVFMLVFVLMILVNRFITKEFIIKHFKEKSKIKIWSFAIISGILSMGPIYMWYPLLAEAKNKGLSYGLIACFLYNRAIKIPLLPLIILYFGIKYVLILTIIMIIMSVAQGILINKLIKEEN